MVKTSSFGSFIAASGASVGIHADLVASATFDSISHGCELVPLKNYLFP